MCDALLEACDLKRDTAHHFADVDLTEVVVRALKNGATTARAKEIEMHFENSLAGENLVMRMDEQKVGQIIDNLISNTIKYSHRGTDIHVRLKFNGEDFILDVCDHGVGIDPTEVDGLFRAFFQTSNEPTAGESSHGLGLYISRKMAQLHGGDLHYRPNTGNGSVFSLCLPFRLTVSN